MKMLELRLKTLLENAEFEINHMEERLVEKKAEADKYHPYEDAIVRGVHDSSIRHMEGRLEAIKEKRKELQGMQALLLV